MAVLLLSVSSEVCLAVPTRWHCMSRSVTLLTRACYVSVKAGTVPVCPCIDIYGLCRACVGRSSGTDPSCLMYIYWQSGGSVCASDLYCNAMQLDMCVVVEASVELFVTQVGEKEVMHFRNS